MPTTEGGRITVFHVVVVALSLLLTLTAWQFSKAQIEGRTTLRFEAARDQALGLIVDRMTKYEDALWGGVAAVESHGGDMTYEAWHIFAQTLRIEEKYPGINGIGIIHFLTPETLPAYLEQQRRTRPDFRVFPPHTGVERMPITFVEPEGINAAALGLDVAHEANRRNAALASRDSGEARISGPIVLVQDADSTPGFLFFAPFYRGAAPDNVADRRTHILGTVYAPFVTHKLMEGLLAKDLREVRFSILDGNSLIYNEHLTEDPTYDPNPMFAEQVSLELYGRTWVLDVRSNLAFREANSFAQPTFILLAGLLIEALIIALLFLMSRANRRAVSYADKVTAALRQESAKLEMTNIELSNKNEELEQFAYVTSHDLRTPIRGIEGLTEMIEEDLEDYLASPSANPEVSQNLVRIHERVNRMNELTRGIMELSQVSAQKTDSAPLRLCEVVDTLALDFGLNANQLQLEGGTDAIHFDTFNLRRVLENLVGNAVKYHDGKRSLRIVVSAKTIGDRCRISVTDNGPGIDPKYHLRIFDVFQTLRCGDAPESTGIGLAIVKKAIERHGGKMTLTSSLGKGAKFSFDWPRQAGNRLSATANEAA